MCIPAIVSIHLCVFVSNQQLFGKYCNIYRVIYPCAIYRKKVVIFTNFCLHIQINHIIKQAKGNQK